MKRYLQVFLLAVAFDLYWTLVVLLRRSWLSAESSMPPIM